MRRWIALLFVFGVSFGNAQAERLEANTYAALGRAEVADESSAMPQESSQKPEAWAGGGWRAQAESLTLMGRFQEAERLLSRQRRRAPHWTDLAEANNLLKALHMRRVGQSRSTCGAESLALVLAALGQQVSVSDLWSALGERPGATMLDLSRVAAQYGWPCTGLRLTPSQLSKLSKPCIAFLEPGHFVVVTAATETDVHFVDPGNPERHWTMDAFSGLWSGQTLARTVDVPIWLSSARLNTSEMDALLGGDCPWHSAPPRPGEQGMGGPSSQPSTPFDGENPCHGRPSWQVNLASMNLVVSDIDVRYRGSGVPTTIMRTYNSDDPYTDGIFGPKWNWNLGMRVEAIGSTESRIFYDEQGKACRFNWNGTQSVYDPASDGTHAILTRLAPDRYKLERPQVRRLLYFDKAGAVWRLSRIEDAFGNSLTVQYPSPDLISVTDSAQRETTLHLRLFPSGKYRVVEMRDVMGYTTTLEYSAVEDLVASTDVVGARSEYEYDPNHYMTALVVPGIGRTTFTYTAGTVGTWVSSVTNAQGKGRTYTLLGTRTVTDENGHTWSSTSEISGNVVRLTSATPPTGGVMALAYGDVNNPFMPTGVVDSLSRSVSLAYDAGGRLSSVTNPLGGVTAFTYDPEGFGCLLKVRDAAGRETNLEYWDEAKGLPRSVVDANGNRTEFVYDPHGRLVEATDARGSTSRFTYDASGNPVTVENPLGGVTEFTYDAYGNVRSSADPSGARTFFDYDPLSRLVSVTYPDGSRTSTDYDCCRITATTDQKMRQTDYLYDELGRLESVADPSGGVTSFAYDFVGNLTAVTDANGHTTQYAYDAWNRPQQTTYPDGSFERYEYDTSGQLLRKMDSNGTVSALSYDAAGRLQAVTAPSGLVRYWYDSVGNLTQTRSAVGVTRYVYDQANQLRRVVNPNGQALSYGYDEVGNRAWMRSPSGVTSYGYDRLGRLVALNAFGMSVFLRYDSAGRCTEITDNTKRIVSSFDQAGRIGSMLTLGAHGETILSERIQYDISGLPVSVVDGSGSRTYYAYDSLDRLVREVRVGDVNPYSYSYTYDAVGNMLTRTDLRSGQTIDYTYDVGNRLLSAGGTAFQYDGNGNVTAKVSPVGTTNYTWDSFNQLIGARAPDGSVVRFYYDPLGNRVARTDSAGTTRYLQDAGASIPAVVLENGVRNVSYVRTPEGLLLGAVVDGQPLSLVFDRVGNLRTALGPGGGLLGTRSYNAWGDTEADAGALPAAVAFGARYGYHSDPQLGITQMGARWYDPSVGRMLSKDPAGYASGLNPYGYAFGNPTTRVDPDGEIPLLLVTGGIGALVGGGTGAWHAYTTGENIWAGAAKGALVGGVAGLTGGAATGLVAGWLGTSVAAATAAGFAGGVVGEAAGQTVELAFGDRCYYDPNKMLVSGVVGGAIGGVTQGMANAFDRNVYRVYGNEAGPYGRSWTTTNPKSMTFDDFNAHVGLPQPKNSGQYATRGLRWSNAGAEYIGASQVGSNPGGGPEIVVSSPYWQIIEVDWWRRY